MIDRLTALALRRTYLLAAALASVLLVANVVVLPQFLAPDHLPATLAAFAPFALLAMASAPSILSGHGGLDLSVAPLMGFVNILLVTKFDSGLIGSPLLAVPVLLAVGTAVGVVNGLSVSILRFPPVITTLCTFFVLTGANLALAPIPQPSDSSWTGRLAGSVAGVPVALLTIGAPLVIWWLLARRAYVRNLLAVGGNDVAAFTAGVPVTEVRVVAYAFGGFLAALAGFALTGLVQTADPNISRPYILVALAAVALGGVSLAGGVGGMIGPLLGAACIFLVQALLTSLHLAATWLQVIYGLSLLVAVSLASVVARRRLTTER